jgi:hypothetical protein
MGSPVHFDGKRMAGTHTTVIDAAQPVVEIIRSSFPQARIQNGFITAGINAKSQSVKIKKLATSIEVIVVSKVTKQSLIIYGECEVEKLVSVLKSHKRLRGLIIKESKT